MFNVRSSIFVMESILFSPDVWCAEFEALRNMAFHENNVLYGYVYVKKTFRESCQWL